MCRIRRWKFVMYLCSIEQKVVKEIEKHHKGENSTPSKKTGCITELYLWFPPSYGLCFVTGIYYIRVAKCQPLQILKTSVVEPPRNLWVSSPLSREHEYMTSKDPFQDTFSHDSKDLGQRKNAVFESTKLFAEICFSLLEFGFSTCLTV